MIDFLRLQWCLLWHRDQWVEEADGTDGSKWLLRRCAKCGSLSVWPA